MIDSEELSRDLLALVVPRWGALQACGDPFAPYRLLDDAGRVVEPVASFFAELQACGRSVSTQRSYGLALLRWFRFVAAVGVAWDQATRVEARDFCRWIQIADKPVRPHWRHPGDTAGAKPASVRAQAGPNPVTGKSAPGAGYARPRPRTPRRWCAASTSSTCRLVRGRW